MDALEPSAPMPVPVVFHRERVYQSEILPPGTNGEAIRIEGSDRWQNEVNRLRLTMERWVLTDELEERTESVVWEEHVRPWWIPRFLWNRIRVEVKVAEFTFKVKRFYPAPPGIDLGPSSVKASSRVEVWPEQSEG